MSKIRSFVFLLAALAAVPSANAQEKAKMLEVKPLPTCMDFADVYARAVLGEAEATASEQREMVSLAATMMGYVSALQDIYGNYLVGMSADDNEWTLLEHAYRFCKRNPQLTFQRAVRSIPPVLQTVEVLQDQEFARCTNYIEQAKPTICAPYCQPKK